MLPPVRERRCCRQPASGCATWEGRPTPGRRPPEGRCQPAARAAGVQLVVAHPLRDYIVCRTRNNAYAGVWPWGGHSYVNTSGLNFRRFCDAAATAVTAGPLRHLGFAGGPKKVTEGAAQTGSNDTIRPFNVDFPEAELTELQKAHKRDQVARARDNTPPTTCAGTAPPPTRPSTGPTSPSATAGRTTSRSSRPSPPPPASPSLTRSPSAKPGAAPTANRRNPADPGTAPDTWPIITRSRCHRRRSAGTWPGWLWSPRPAKRASRPACGSPLSYRISAGKRTSPLVAGRPVRRSCCSPQGGPGCR